jgi:phospholipase/carboxylesterase
MESGHLTFRPRPSTGKNEGRDEPLGLEQVRDGVLYVPDTAEKNAPLILFLHGAGGTGRRELRAVVAAADTVGAVIAAPDSRGPTWDIIVSQEFGPDVDFFDRVLNDVVDRVDVDTDHLAIGGISDGASYALSIGVSNGDVFGSIVAYSPGFAVASETQGKPRIFISHGTQDQVLPIDQCGRRLAYGLDGDGYDVTYLEFDGGHTVPPTVAEQGFRWWIDRL